MECSAIVRHVNDHCPLARPSDEEYYFETNNGFGVYGVAGQTHAMFKFFHGSWCVYRITNLENGKVYHGHTDNPQRRILEHCENSSKDPADSKMIADFIGREKACTFEILFICSTKAEAREIEKSYNDRLIKGKIYCYNTYR